MYNEKTHWQRKGPGSWWMEEPPLAVALLSAAGPIAALLSIIVLIILAATPIVFISVAFGLMFAGPVSGGLYFVTYKIVEWAKKKVRVETDEIYQTIQSNIVDLRASRVALDTLVEQYNNEDN